VTLPRTPSGRVAAGLAAAVGLFAAAVVALERLAPEPRGPESSTYATAPAGLAAYADLLRDAGHRVERRRRPLADRPRVSEGTLVVLDARAVPPAETRAIARFVRGGGRLVAGGVRLAPWLEPALGRVPERRDAGSGDARPLAPAPETAGVAVVRTADGGAWRGLGDALPVLGPADGPLAVVKRSGRGRVVLLADASPLQNRGLGAADNAAFALALAGPPGEPVTFLETVHGYGAQTGLAALPERARWALAGLLLAALAFAWSHARRIGPPEEDELPLPPPRGDYVDALAGALVRTRAPADVARPLREAARDRLAVRAGLGAEPPERELRDAAARFGLGEAETAALVDGPRGLEGALAAGRALAHLETAASVAATGDGEAPGGRAKEAG
jgi:hypothetical protein